MKKLTKLLPTILLIILALTFSLAACNSPDNSGTGNPPTKKSSTEVIKESIVKLESSVLGSTSPNGVSPMAFVIPNGTVEYAPELQSIFRGSGMGLYAADYVATYFDDFSTDTVYLDDSISGLTFLFQTKNSSTGVNSTMEMHTGGTKNQINMFFNYDYTLNEPTDTSVVMMMSAQNVMRIAIAKFDYLTETAYSFELAFAHNDEDALNEHLTNGTLSFEQFITYEVMNYKLAKINLANKSVKSYVFNIGSSAESISATQEQVDAFYTEIYDGVKDVCKPAVYLETTGATNLEYYKRLFTYISSKTAIIVHEDKLISTYVTYEQAKSYLTILTSELDKDKYADSMYDNVKTELNKCLTYVNSITEQEYSGQLTADVSLMFVSPQIVPDSDAISYLFTNEQETISMVFAIKNGELINIAFAN